MYLAFDVGIANLAFCILNEKGEILKWEIVNLTDLPSQPTCTGTTKKGSVCGKGAKFISDCGKEAFCAIHKKSIPKNTILFSIVKTPICQREKCTAKIRHCHKDNQYKGWCGTHIKLACVAHKEDYVPWSKPLAASALGKDLDLLTNRLFSRLDQIPELLEVDHIGIENQPCLKQPVMKTIQIALYSYLKLKSKQPDNTTFRMINASEKCPGKTYAERKKNSIVQCRELLEINKEENKDWLELFNKHKKRDDLADSYNLCKVLMKKCT